MSRFRARKHLLAPSSGGGGGGGGGGFYNSPLVDLTVTIGDSWIGNTNPIFTGNYTGPYYQAHPEHPVINMGLGGTGLDYIVSRLTDIIALRPYRVYIDTCRNDFADDNRYGGSGSSNAVVLAAYENVLKTQIIDPLKAALPGVQIVKNTVLQLYVGTYINAAFQTRYDANRVTHNTNLRAWVASGYIAAVADYAADPTLSNTAVYPDNGIHLNDYPGAGNGSTVAAPVFAATMDGLDAAYLIPARIDFDAANGWSSGQNPPAIAITLPSDGSIQVGDFYRAEFSQNSFVTSSFSPWNQITSDDVLSSGEAGSFSFTWGSTLATGATSFRVWFGRGADANNITVQSSYPTNTLTDTLAAPSASATLVSTTGPLKSRFVSLLSTNQFSVNTPVSAPCLIAVNQLSANPKHHLEWLIGHVRDNLYLGYFDSTVNFNTSGIVNNLPGSSGGGNGFTARIANTGEFVFYANGVVAVYNAPGWANGDSIAFELDETGTPAVNIYRVRSGTPLSIGSVSLTTQIPGTWRAFGGGSFTDGDGTTVTNSDCATLVAASASWAMTPNTGFNVVYA